MLVNSEPLNCDICGKDFIGRKANDNVENMCPECVNELSLPLINEDKDVTENIEEEIAEGRGEDDE